MRKPLVLHMLAMTFVIWQWVQPVRSVGMEFVGVEKGEESEGVIHLEDGSGGWPRDPFSLPPGVKQKSEMEQFGQIPSQEKPIKVEGVLVSGSLKRVVIDGEIFSIGDRLENWRIMDIQRSSVILEAGEGRLEIPVEENPLSPSNGL